MSSDWYTLLSMGMRYWFIGLVIVIVFNAWRGALRDSRNARKLRNSAPITGAIGEIVITAGGGRHLKTGSRIPVPREGLLGSSRRADVQLDHRDVRRFHARLELRENGLLAETLGHELITLGKESGKRLLLRNGDRFSIGGLRMLLVMYDDNGLPHGLPDDDDDLFDAIDPEFSRKKKTKRSQTTADQKGRSSAGSRNRASVRSGKTGPEPSKKSRKGVRDRKTSGKSTVLMPFESRAFKYSKDTEKLWK